MKLNHVSFILFCILIQMKAMVDNTDGLGESFKATEKVFKKQEYKVTKDSFKRLNTFNNLCSNINFIISVLLFNIL